MLELAFIARQLPPSAQHAQKLSIYMATRDQTKIDLSHVGTEGKGTESHCGGEAKTRRSKQGVGREIEERGEG